MRHKLLATVFAVVLVAAPEPAHATTASANGSVLKNVGVSRCVTAGKAAAGNWAPWMETCRTGAAAKNQIHDITQPEGTYYTIQIHEHGVCLGAKYYWEKLYHLIYISCTDKSARFMRFPAPGGYRYAMSDGIGKGDYLFGDEYAAHLHKEGQGTDRIWTLQKS